MINNIQCGIISLLLGFKHDVKVGIVLPTFYSMNREW